MTLTSLSFYLLVLALLVLYYLVPKRFQWVVLLIGSYAFYAFVCLRYMGFIVITTLTTYFGARGMDAMTAHMEQTVAAHKQDWEREERKAYKKRCKSRRKALMIAILLLNFGILAVLKYYNFFAESMETLFASVGLTVSLGHIGLLLPLGISFYTFQSMGYVLDVYREKVPAERNVGKLALFVSFFPQIIQGPIGVYDQLAHQLYDEHKYNFDNIRFGAQLILWGFFKKLVIADRAAILVNNVISETCPYGGAVIATGIFFYCIQLYCDFSGGIDITRGVARMFGIDMVQNFRRPLFATSLTDYWRRWHITLGSWMRDYVFYPLSLSKPFGKLGKWARKHLKGTPGKIFATSAATFIVYLIIGIWHGANFRYIAFGLWNGTLITASLLMERRFLAWKSALHINDKSTGWRIFMTVRTALLVFIGRYFTRAPRLTVVFSLLKTTVLHPNFGELPHKILTLGLTAGDLLIVAAGILIVHIVEFFEERGTDVRGWLNARKSSVQVLILLVSLLILAFFGIFRSGYISSEFIYGQF